MNTMHNKYNSMLSQYSKRFIELSELNDKDDEQEKIFTFLFHGEEVYVKFRFRPFSVRMNEDLPVISHFEFQFKGILKNLFQSNYWSFFFQPILLNDYNNIEDAAKDACALKFKDSGITENHIQIQITKSKQLVLF